MFHAMMNPQTVTARSTHSESNVVEIPNDTTEQEAKAFAFGQESYTSGCACANDNQQFSQWLEAQAGEPKDLVTSLRLLNAHNKGFQAAEVARFHERNA